MANIIHSICQKYEGSKYFVGNIPEKNIGAVYANLNIPQAEKIIAFANVGNFDVGKYGVAICQRGIYWKNDTTTDTRKNYLSWQELAGASIESKGMFDISLGNGNHIGTAALYMKRKDLVALLNELKQAVINNPQDFPPPIPTAHQSLQPQSTANCPVATVPVNYDYSQRFRSVVGGVGRAIAGSVLAKKNGLYSIISTTGMVAKELNEALVYLRRPENVAQIDAFMHYLYRDTPVLTSDEFPVFGYASDFSRTGKKGWICTNKRIYRSKFMGVQPIIELAKVEKYKAKEDGAGLDFSYGFMNGSDWIEFSFGSNGVFSQKFNNQFDALVRIFQYLASLR